MIYFANVGEEKERECPVCNKIRDVDDFVRPCGSIAGSCVWCRRGVKKK